MVNDDELFNIGKAEYPISCFGYVEYTKNQQVYRSFGCLISPYHVLTEARPLLKMDRSAIIEEELFYSCFSEQQDCKMQSMSSKVEFVFVNKYLFTCPAEELDFYDFAVVQLQQPLGIRQGYLGLFYPVNSDYFVSTDFTLHQICQSTQTAQLVLRELQYVGYENEKIQVYGAQGTGRVLIKDPALGYCVMSMGLQNYGFWQEISPFFEQKLIIV